MRLIKIVNQKPYLICLVFILLFLATRLPALGTDVINPDGVNWHYRSEQFVVGLKLKQFERTYQHYHPGVTLMWLTGSASEFIKQVFPAESVYSHINFLTYHFLAKFVLVFSQLLLSILSIYLLFFVLKTDNTKHSLLKSFFIVSLFSFEPFFIGNSRLLHMDVLLTLLLFNGLLASYLALKKLNFWQLILAGAFLGLAFLTKSVAIGSIIYVLGFGLLYLVKTSERKDIRKKILRFTLPVFLTFIVTIFLFFPALWVTPFSTLFNIFDEAERIGIRKGHGQIFFGTYTRDPGFLFYIFVFLIKVSPFTLVGILFNIFVKQRTILKQKANSFFELLKQKNSTSIFQKNLSFEVYLLIFYLGYILVMIFPTKKLDRYMLLVWPLLAVFAVSGYFKMYNSVKANLKRTYTFIVATLALVFLLGPFLSIHPYLFTYTSPIFLNSTIANKIIAQKPFGVGVVNFRKFIFEKYGDFPRLGVIDKKPMAAIYKNSNICDIRVCGTSDYDLLVLTVNEVVPEKVLKSDVKFIHDSSFYINGLEYFRVYVKEKLD